MRWMRRVINTVIIITTDARPGDLASVWPVQLNQVGTFGVVPWQSHAKLALTVTRVVFFVPCGSWVSVQSREDMRSMQALILPPKMQVPPVTRLEWPGGQRFQFIRD
jgi:hypothetical protein